MFIKNDYGKMNAWAKVLEIHIYVTDRKIGAKKQKPNKKQPKYINYRGHINLHNLFIL